MLLARDLGPARERSSAEPPSQRVWPGKLQTFRGEHVLFPHCSGGGAGRGVSTLDAEFFYLPPSPQKILVLPGRTSWQDEPWNLTCFSAVADCKTMQGSPFSSSPHIDNAASLVCISGSIPGEAAGEAEGRRWRSPFSSSLSLGGLLSGWVKRVPSQNLDGFFPLLR